jgi:PHD/YefM family antitoxin component YafN of YafNO toxin-antitoxin module
MKSTVTTTEAQARLPRLLKELPKRKALTITNHGRVAGFLVSPERMAAIIETMELMGNEKAMRAIRDYESGRAKGKDIRSLE